MKATLFIKPTNLEDCDSKHSYLQFYTYLFKKGLLIKALRTNSEDKSYIKFLKQEIYYFQQIYCN